MTSDTAAEGLKIAETVTPRHCGFHPFGAAAGAVGTPGREPAGPRASRDPAGAVLRVKRQSFRYHFWFAPPLHRYAPSTVVGVPRGASWSRQ
ncbi:hypothetical protein GCM10010428_66970 [Actinosynnema pretiosum subsp. pretiosum]